MIDLLVWSLTMIGLFCTKGIGDVYIDIERDKAFNNINIEEVAEEAKQRTDLYFERLEK